MNRFPALTVTSTLLKIIAVLIAIGGFLVGLGVGDDFGRGPFATIAFWIITATYVIGLWAAAELIDVLLAIEENTRQTAEEVRGSRRQGQGQVQAPVTRPVAARNTEQDRPTWMR